MWLIFDVDRSLASIGGYKEAERLFGVPPIPISKGIDEILTYLRKLFVKKRVVHKHPLFGVESVEERIALNEFAEEQGLQGIIIDTLSIAAEQTRELINKERNTAVTDLQGWGIFSDRVMRFLRTLAIVPTTVICNVHVDRSKDELGQILDAPAIKGSSKWDIPRLFDVILYGVVSQNEEGEREWLWQTKPDNRRVLAKDRLGVLPDRLPQDFSKVITPYHEKGISPKILVVADSGHGKTFALKTLVNNN